MPAAVDDRAIGLDADQLARVRNILADLVERFVPVASSIIAYGFDRLSCEVPISLMVRSASTTGAGPLSCGVSLKMSRLTIRS